MLHRSILASAFLVLLVTSCTRSRFVPAFGSYSEIVLVTSVGVPPGGLEVLRAALESPLVYVGQEERRFRVIPAPARRLAGQFFAKNLALVSLLDAPGQVGEEVRRLLGREEAESLRRRGAGYFLRRDVWARGQVVVLLTATRSAGLDTLLRGAGRDLADALERSSLERLRAELLAAGEGRVRAAELRARHGFEIRVPALYRMLPESPAWPAAVEMVRSAPTRLLGVFWLDGVDSLQAGDPRFVAGLQRDVMWRLHGDTLVEERTRVESSRFGPYADLCLTGVWQNSGDVAGGVLQTHFVYDAARRRLYGVQALLFAPGHDKHPFLRELRALAETFRLRGRAP